MWQSAFIGKKLEAVAYTEFETDRKPPSRLFLIFEDEAGEQSHVEIYASYDYLLWSNPRGGGIEAALALQNILHLDVWPRRGPEPRVS